MEEQRLTGMMATPLRARIRMDGPEEQVDPANGREGRIRSQALGRHRPISRRPILRRQRLDQRAVINE